MIQRRLFQGLGLSYKKTHVCPNECIMYRKDLVDAEICPNAICQDGNATLMMLNVQKRYRQRFFIGSLLYLDCKDFLYHQKWLILWYGMRMVEPKMDS